VLGSSFSGAQPPCAFGSGPWPGGQFVFGSLLPGMQLPFIDGSGCWPGGHSMRGLCCCLPTCASGTSSDDENVEPLTTAVSFSSASCKEI
jgi:hypothetical protein